MRHSEKAKLKSHHSRRIKKCLILLLEQYNCCITSISVQSGGFFKYRDYDVTWVLSFHYVSRFTSQLRGQSFDCNIFGCFEKLTAGTLQKHQIYCHLPRTTLSARALEKNRPLIMGHSLISRKNMIFTNFHLDVAPSSLVRFLCDYPSFLSVSRALQRRLVFILIHFMDGNDF